MTKSITFIENNVCAPKGFQASGISAGIKKSGKPDLSLIYSEVPAIAAGVFTKNRVKAAPLLLTKNNVKKGKLQAIITNSGNANACTGKLGTINAKQTAIELAKHLSIQPELVAVSSTGVIGVQLAIDTLLAGIPNLTAELSANGGNKAAKAILTTDTFIKQAAVKVTLSDGTLVTLGGIAKGSGMIHPNMATMLGYITSDIAISADMLQNILTQAVNSSFNMISVDGDSSTNDMVIVMANGCAKNKLICDTNNPDWSIFYDALLVLCTHLAKEIAKDGEGASKLITVEVAGAKSVKQARIVAKSVVSSSLVKAAIFGNDANWGRIACAVGYAETVIDPDKLKIALEDLVLFENGLPINFSEEIALTLLKQTEVKINVDLGLGSEKSTAWGCDLTYDYVKINAAYRT